MRISGRRGLFEAIFGLMSFPIKSNSKPWSSRRPSLLHVWVSELLGTHSTPLVSLQKHYNVSMTAGGTYNRSHLWRDVVVSQSNQIQEQNLEQPLTFISWCPCPIHIIALLQRSLAWLLQYLWANSEQGVSFRDIFPAQKWKDTIILILRMLLFFAIKCPE